MSSNNKEIKAGAGYMFGNILIKGISFITLPVFTRLMSTSDYGLYNTYVAYEAIITILIGLGLNASIKNAKYDYSNKVNFFTSTLCVMTLATSIIMLLISVLFSQLLSSFTGFIPLVLILLVLQSFGSAIVNIKNAELSLEYEYKKYLLIAGINTVLNVSLSLVFILFIFQSNTFFGRVLGSSIPLFLIGIFCSLDFFKKARTNLFDKSMAKYALIIGLPLVWHYLSQQVASQFDRIMITNMVGASSTGIYSFVYTIANIFAILFYSTDNAWGVWFFSQMEIKDYENIHKKSVYYMLLMTVIACVMMIFSKEVILILGTEKYLEGANLFVPIIIGMYFLFLYTIPVGIEYYFKKTKYIATLTFISALINIVLNYICIKAFGYQAAAYTTAISYLVMFLCHWIISGKLLKDNNLQPIYHLSDYVLFSVIVIAVGIFTIITNPIPILKYLIFISVFIIISIIYRHKIFTIIHELMGIRKQ